MYNNSCMLSSYTNNCSQHQWVLNLMRFIIIEIEHTNLVGVQGTESFENGEFPVGISCGSLAFLTTHSKNEGGKFPPNMV